MSIESQPPTRTWITAVALVLAVAGPAVGSPPDDDAKKNAQKIEEFRRFYNSRNVKVRRAAILDAKGMDGVEALKLILDCFDDRDAEVQALAQEALNEVKEKRAVEQMLKMARLGSDDTVKARIARAFYNTDHPAVMPVLRGMIKHRNPEVRRAVAYSLGEKGDKEAVDALVDAVKDEKAEDVKQTMFEALGKIGDERASPILEQSLGDGPFALQVSAIESLAKLRTKSGVGALIEQMQKTEGRLLTDIRNALETLTGEVGFKEDKAKWKAWWDRFHKGFRVPSLDHLKNLAEKRKAAAEAYAPRKYHNIETWSQHIVFLIDVSGSMADKVVIPAGKEAEFNEKYDSRVKIDIVKQELINLLADLDKEVSFQIITFASKVKPWTKGLVRASSGNKAKFIKKLYSMQVIGGINQGGRQRGGGNLQSGRTNTYGALMQALRVPQSGKDKTGRLVKTKADTVFFLSDGLPTIGETTDPADILRRIRRFNQTRKMVLHTIGFDQANRSFMMGLARDNGGQYVLIGGE